MRYTVAAVCCMMEKETGAIIVDPDGAQLKVFIDTTLTSFSPFSQQVCFHRSILVYRTQRQNLHLPLTVLTRMSYVATASVDSRKPISWHVYTGASKLASPYSIITGKSQKTVQI